MNKASEMPFITGKNGVKILRLTLISVWECRKSWNWILISNIKTEGELKPFDIADKLSWKVCKSCGEICDHIYRNGVCLFCLSVFGVTFALTVFQLFRDARLIIDQSSIWVEPSTFHKSAGRLSLMKERTRLGNGVSYICTFSHIPSTFEYKPRELMHFPNISPIQAPHK